MLLLWGAYGTNTSIEMALSCILNSSKSIFTEASSCEFSRTLVISLFTCSLFRASSPSRWYILCINGYCMQRKTIDIPRDTKAIHQAGTPPLPPVSMAVSLPPAHSAAIRSHPHSPRSLKVKQARGPVSLRSMSITSSSENSPENNPPPARRSTPIEDD